MTSSRRASKPLGLCFIICALISCSVLLMMTHRPSSTSLSSPPIIPRHDNKGKGHKKTYQPLTDSSENKRDIPSRDSGSRSGGGSSSSSSSSSSPSQTLPLYSAPTTTRDVHLFVVWPDAYKAKHKIIDDIRSRFTVWSVVEFTWAPDTYLENLWRLYSGKGGEARAGMKLKVKQCGKGPFTVLVVEDRSPEYRDEHTAHGVDHVNHHMNDRKKTYRSWAGGGFRVHGTFNPQEADHDLFMLFGRNRAELLAEYAEVPWTGVEKKAQQPTFGFKAWTSCDQLERAIVSAVPEAQFIQGSRCGDAMWSLSSGSSDAVFRTLLATIYHYKHLHELTTSEAMLSVKVGENEEVNLKIVRT
eukprot:PhM_4_TR5790/c0_g1_i1/m.67511